MTPTAGAERGAQHHYRLCGLRLASDFKLAALPPWHGDGPVDISCRLGTVAARLEDPDRVEPIFQTARGRDYLLALPGAGRILVRDGSAITVEPEADAASNLSPILTGTVQAVLWHQRRLLPLHASALLGGDRAIALCGPAAAGKSTLAAMLAAQGHRVIADDVCVVDAQDKARARVLAGGPRLQLWRDALNELGIAAEGLERALPHKERYFVELGDRAATPSHELAAIVQIVRNAPPPVALSRLRGSQAADVLYNCIHSPRPADALGRARPIFADLVGLVAAGVSVWRLAVPEGFAGLRQAAAALSAVLES